MKKNPKKVFEILLIILSVLAMILILFVATLIPVKTTSNDGRTVKYKAVLWSRTEYNPPESASFLPTGLVIYRAGQKIYDDAIYYNVCEDYVSNTYGSDFKIVNYTRLNETPDSADKSHTDLFDVEQNGFVYSVYVKDGFVIKDTYKKNCAGPIFVNYIICHMKDTSSLPDLTDGKTRINAIVNVYKYIGGNEICSDEEIAVDFSSASTPLEVTTLVNHANGAYDIDFSIDILDNRDIYQEHWIYNFYETVRDEFGNTNFYIKTYYPNSNVLHYEAFISGFYWNEKSFFDNLVITDYSH